MISLMYLLRVLCWHKMNEAGWDSWVTPSLGVGWAFSYVCGFGSPSGTSLSLASLSELSFPWLLATS